MTRAPTEKAARAATALGALAEHRQQVIERQVELIADLRRKIHALQVRIKRYERGGKRRDPSPIPRWSKLGPRQKREAIRRKIDGDPSRAEPAAGG